MKSDFIPIEKTLSRLRNLCGPWPVKEIALLFEAECENLAITQLEERVKKGICPEWIFNELYEAFAYGYLAAEKKFNPNFNENFNSPRSPVLKYFFEEERIDKNKYYINSNDSTSKIQP